MDFDAFADLIEAALFESSSDNVLEPVSKLANMKKEEVAERIAELDMGDISDLIDAVNANDEAKVLLILNYAKNVDEDDEDETIDVEDEDDANMHPDRMPDSQHGLLPPGITEAISVGQEVEVDGRGQGVIKIADGPGNTAGILIDGEMQMVDKKKIKRVDETVLGMTAMPGLKRMQELAGIASAAPATMAVADVAQPVVAQPAAAEEVKTLDLPNTEEAAVVSGDSEAIEKVEAEIESDAEAEEAEADCDEEECDEEGAERPHEVSPQVDPEAEILAALEVIEKNIRDVKVGAFKTINDRIQAIQGSLFESAVIRRKPL